MINLLPPEGKKQLRAARSNVLLLRYNFLVLAALLFLVVGLGAVYVYLTAQKQAAEATISDNTQREGAFKTVKEDAAQFQNELKSAKTILDSQVSYSQAFIRISALMPDGTALKDKLDLTETILAAPITMTVKIKNEAAAQTLLNTFKASKYVKNIVKNSIGIGSGDFPYTMDVTIVFKKEILSL